MSEINIDAIKSRLGSVSPVVKAQLPQSVFKILTLDLPLLIEFYEGKNENGKRDSVSFRTGNKGLDRVSNSQGSVS